MNSARITTDTLPRGFTITPCLEPEFRELLASEPEMLARIEASRKGAEVLYPNNCYTISYKQYRLVFSFFLLREGVYEGHVACPKASTIASRALILAAMSWILTEAAPEAVAILTRCPAGKIANTAKKLGFKETKVEGEDSYFTFVRK